jgi:microcystin-dependent protein
MSQPYVGEIRMFAGNFAPAGWMLCQGQTLPISENEVLFQLIGTTYGGDGESTFNLPNLASRVPMHMGTFQGTTFQIGQAAGAETVTLTTQQIPVHNHMVESTVAAGTVAVPSNSTILGSEGPIPNTANVYLPYTNANQIVLANQTIGQTGGNQPHENIQPYLAINFIISLFGIFPTQ